MDKIKINELTDEEKTYLFNCYHEIEYDEDTDSLDMPCPRGKQCLRCSHDPENWEVDVCEYLVIDIPAYLAERDARNIS